MSLEYGSSFIKSNTDAIERIEVMMGQAAASVLWSMYDTKEVLLTKKLNGWIVGQEFYSNYSTLGRSLSEAFRVGASCRRLFPERKSNLFRTYKDKGLHIQANAFALGYQVSKLDQYKELYSGEDSE